MGDLLELGVLLVERVVEVFNLGHLELPNSQQTAARTDFISKSRADLSARERQLPLVEVEESEERRVLERFDNASPLLLVAIPKLFTVV